MNDTANQSLGELFWQRLRRRSSVLLLAILALVLTSCNPTSPAHSVEKDKYLALQDKNGHVLFYGMKKSEIEPQFNTEYINGQWEGAHENLEIRFTSSLIDSDPTIVQMSVTRQPDHENPSWTLPQGISIGASRKEVFSSFDTPDNGEQVLDLLFAQDPQYQGKMYQIPQDDLWELAPEVAIYRVALQFEEDALTGIVLGDLESME